MKLYGTLLAAALIASASAGWAQQPMSITIDGYKITAKYTAPAAKQRLAVNFHTDADLAFRGARVPTGNYTLYLLDDGAQWQLAVNRATGAKAATYDPKLDIGRANLSMTKGAATPAAKVTLVKSAALAGKLQISWKDAVATASFHLDRSGNDSEW